MSIILSTWSFGQQANRAAWPILTGGGSSLDAVEAACRDAESDLTNHTVGKGGWPDAAGEVSLDASIMLSPAKCGAVACVRKYEHPISIARRVMEQTPHILLTGEGSERFAAEQGFEQTDLLSDEVRQAYQTWLGSREKNGSLQAGKPVRNIEEQGLAADSHDTIGVLCIDAHGTLAGGCTTSGMQYKLPGRVGDSPNIGQALYVSPGIGAAVGTGHGELMMSVCGAFLAVENLRRGASPAEAAMEVLKRIAQSQDLTEEDQIGLIVLQANGTWGAAALRGGFQVAVKDGMRDELVRPEGVLL